MNNKTISLHFYVYLLLCTALNTSCMEVNEHYDQPFPIDEIPRIAKHLDLSTTIALLNTCTTHNNIYPNRTIPNIKHTSHAIDRLLYHCPKLCTNLNKHDSTILRIHYAQTNNETALEHVRTYEDDKNYALKIRILTFFDYNYLDHFSPHAYKNAYLGAPNQDLLENAHIEQRKNELLIKAAAENKIHELIILLKNGADVNAFDANGSTALHHAAGRGHTEIAQILMNNNADKTIQNNGYHTPFSIALAVHLKHNPLPMVAILRDQIDVDIVKSLLK